MAISPVFVLDSGRVCSEKTSTRVRKVRSALVTTSRFTAAASALQGERAGQRSPKRTCQEHEGQPTPNISGVTSKGPVDWIAKHQCRAGSAFRFADSENRKASHLAFWSSPRDRLAGRHSDQRRADRREDRKLPFFYVSVSRVY